MNRIQINPRAVAIGAALGIIILAALAFFSGCAGVKTLGAPSPAAAPSPSGGQGEHTWMDEVSEQLPMIGGVLLIAAVITGLWFAAVRWNGSRKRHKAVAGSTKTTPLDSIRRESPAAGAGPEPTKPPTETPP